MCKLWIQLTCVTIASLAAGCRPAASTGNATKLPTRAADDSPEVDRPVDTESMRAEVTAFCGDCHAMPPVSAFSKEEWPREVIQGYEFYRTSGRYDLQPPRQSSVVAFFQAQAPDKIVLEEPQRAAKPLSVRFRRQVLSRPAGANESAVAFLLWQPHRDGAGGKLLVSDIKTGGLYEIPLPAAELSATKLADLGHPAIIEPSDLDADGQTDYLIGDLGSFMPADHDQGRVLWLKARGDAGWSAEVLRAGLGRVSQAVSGDFDGDSDADVLIAEFGWQTTGRLLLLKQNGGAGGGDKYETVVLDPRHGTSHLRPLDWDQDGDLDFVALISQEHEKLELFVNDGKGHFQVQTVFAADDPAYGFSGMDLVDFDGDGDLDVLLTNGDSMDSSTLKPSHAVRWLENEGTLPFTMHRLSVMPGAYKAVTGDLDADGDLDVVAMAFPPGGTSPESWPTKDLLAILEQTAPGEFVHHVLPEPVGGGALALGDFDGDGDLDFASGTFFVGKHNQWVTVWWNEGKK